MLLDPDKLPIGTNLSLLPLNINERHSYYEKGQKVEKSCYNKRTGG